ncbi:MAG: InlB B-repeat-containing protein [Clostridia bacterium]|nr:InlB B-repeat-containing protein [Clostridia bacterium]
MDKIIEFFVGIYENHIAPFVYDIFPGLYGSEWIVLLVLGIVILLIITLIVAANTGKKIIFIAEGKRYAKTKSKKNKPIKFPIDPEMDGYVFEGWFKDKKFKVPYTKTVVNKKTNLNTVKLYAKFTKIAEDAPVADKDAIDIPSADTAPATTAPATETPATTPVVDSKKAKLEAKKAEKEAKKAEKKNKKLAPVVVSKEEAKEIDIPAEVAVPAEPAVEENEGLGKYYDNLRYAMLGYERASQFKKLGVQRKQVVAQMFEGNDAVNLYLAIDPELMKVKGHNVEKFDRPEFAVAPCRKVVKTEQDYEEALALIKDAMLINNLVKSDTVFAKPVKSDEQTRKSGFAFFVKNETVATTSADYYRLLRAVVLSYKPEDSSKIADEINGKMILKIFKKDETINIYLALNPEAEGLTNVGYDKNFADTPAMFEVKESADCKRANELIEKLMFTYGMVKNPESVEISLEDAIDKNCGFGYRIKK